MFQVHKLSKNGIKIKILVCAPTNHAADLVTEGILDGNQVPERDVLRMHAASRPYDCYSSKVIAIQLLVKCFNDIIVQKICLSAHHKSVYQFTINLSISSL